jgi:hypothetical protein
MAPMVVSTAPAFEDSYRTSSVHRHSTTKGHHHQEGQQEEQRRERQRRRRQQVGKKIWEYLIDPSEKHDNDKSKLQQFLDDNHEEDMGISMDHMEIKDLQEIYESLTCSIRILDGQQDDAFLQAFDGQLVDIQPQILEWIKDHTPDFSARVADFNENLLFSLQRCRGLQHLTTASSERDEQLLQELEQTLQTALGGNCLGEYQGSYMMTERTNPQPPHVDFRWEVLKESQDGLSLAFFPLTKDGCFLQVWPRNDNATQVEGTVVFIPYGKCLFLPSHTIHGGGFQSSSSNNKNKQGGGNLRFHLYLANRGTKLPAFQNNRYTEATDCGRELCERYVNAPHMQELLDLVFE